MENVVVSVLMVTYGHELYIEKAISSVLSQKCDFEFELIIANDKSPDNTDSVVKKILKDHPKKDVVNYLSHEQNLGIVRNFIAAANVCRGKYIAICEGDDYWTDDLKLQQQVDFLEKNDDYFLATHNAFNIYEGSTRPDEEFIKDAVSKNISLTTILKSWIIPTASMLFRASLIKELPKWIINIYSFDFTLALLCVNNGKVWFDSKVMSVYRINYSGTSATATIGKNMIFVLNEHTKLLNHFNAETNQIYSSLINKKLDSIQKEKKFIEVRQKGLVIVFIKMPILFIKKSIQKIFRVF